MHNSTLCYITRGNDVLMLHRVKKKNDVNQDKWIGIGGKFEADETPDECLLREALEETGLTLTSWKCRGVVTFLTNGPWDGEYMHLFTADGFEGELTECIVALQKQTYNCAMLTLEAVDRVTITTDEQLDWTLDGECEHGKPEVDVRCLHHAVRIVRRSDV